MQISGKINRYLLDLDLLRAALAVADCGSFTVAAAKLNSTQSTVSQQVRRLEQMVGHRLFDRTNREIHPTDAGATLLGYAGRMLSLNDEAIEAMAGAMVTVTVRLGVPEDFAAGRTMHSLAAFNRSHPHVKLEVTSGLSRDLLASYDRGELDVVLVKQRRNSREAIACWPEKLQWIDSAAHPSAREEPVPLVVFPTYGLYRDDMIRALERAGRRWYIRFTSSSLEGIQAAVADGMGISLLPARVVTRGHVALTKRNGFPVIDTIEIALHHRGTAEPEVRELAGMLSRMLEKGR